MKKGSIKVSVLYPNHEGKKFDMDYYVNKHIPMVTSLLGDAIIGASVDKGIGGGAPGLAAKYVSIGNLHFNTIEDFQTSFGPNTAAIMADLPNFTDIAPIVQISEIAV